MAVCPKCKQKIESLNNYESGEMKSYLNEDGGWEEDYFQGDGKTNDFECPNCQEVLFKDEEEAIEFLEDKDELTRIMEEKIEQIKEKKIANG